MRAWAGVYCAPAVRSYNSITLPFQSVMWNLNPTAFSALMCSNSSVLLFRPLMLAIARDVVQSGK